MGDQRSKIEKLRAMAEQTASPAEAEIARRILEEVERGEREWGESRDPEEVFQRFARGTSIERDAIEIFAKAFGFRVEFDIQQRPMVARWEGDIRTRNAPISAMVRALRSQEKRSIEARKEIEP